MYHFGCWLEYRLGIEDTARVVPVHGLWLVKDAYTMACKFASFFCSGLWSLIAVSIFLFGDKAECTLHATFEGICFCRLKLPQLV